MWNTKQMNFGMGGASSQPSRAATGPTTPSFGPRDHLVPWGQKAFPQDGSGITMKIAPGDRVRFQAVDDEYHNLAEAVMEPNSSEPCGYSWRPHPSPQFKHNHKNSRNFDKVMSFPEEGIYHMVCPIEDNHKVMRLTVLASTDKDHLQAFDQAKQQDLARQGLTSAPVQSSSMFPSFGGFSLASMFPKSNLNFMSPHCVIGPLGAVVDCPPVPQRQTAMSMPPFFSQMFGRPAEQSQPLRTSPPHMDEATEILNGI